MPTHPSPRLVLASASPARLRTLQAAGIPADVVVSGVDESTVEATAAEVLSGTLARLKARSVADRLRRRAGDTAGLAASNELGKNADDDAVKGASQDAGKGASQDAGKGASQDAGKGTSQDAAKGTSRDANEDADTDAGGGSDTLVLGCDSVLAFDGEIFGKPADAAEATKRWQRMRGRSGVLYTGHCLIHLGDRSSTDRVAEEVGTTTVRFADVTDAEIAAYVATGEPLRVAGAFTIDGIGGPFVTGIDGDHGTVIGLSLPLLRRLLATLNLPIHTLWHPPPPPPRPAILQLRW